MSRSDIPIVPLFSCHANPQSIEKLAVIPRDPGISLDSTSNLDKMYCNMRIKYTHTFHPVSFDLLWTASVPLLRIYSSLIGARALSTDTGRKSCSCQELSRALQTYAELRHAKVFPPSIFIAQEPQIPSRQDLNPIQLAGDITCFSTNLRNVNVGSCSYFILNKASSTIGPHLSRN